MMNQIAPSPRAPRVTVFTAGYRDRPTLANHGAGHAGHRLPFSVSPVQADFWNAYRGDNVARPAGVVTIAAPVAGTTDSDRSDDDGANSSLGMLMVIVCAMGCLLLWAAAIAVVLPYGPAHPPAGTTVHQRVADVSPR